MFHQVLLVSLMTYMYLQIKLSRLFGKFSVVEQMLILQKHIPNICTRRKLMYSYILKKNKYLVLRYFQITLSICTNGCYNLLMFLDNTMLTKIKTQKYCYVLLFYYFSEFVFIQLLFHVYHRTQTLCQTDGFQHHSPSLY